MTSLRTMNNRKTSMAVLHANVAMTPDQLFRTSAAAWQARGSGQFYDTICEKWNPDGTITVTTWSPEGVASTSTVRPEQ